MSTADVLKRFSVPKVEFVDESDDEAAGIQGKASVGFATPLEQKAPTFISEVLDAEELKVVARLKHPKAEYRFNALVRARGFAQDKLVACAADIALLLSDPSMSNRQVAILALDKLASQDFAQHLDAFASVVKNSPAAVREKAVDAMMRHTPTAPAALQAREDAAAKVKQEAGQVKVWMLKQEEKKQAREVQDIGKAMAQRNQSEEETRRKREALEADKRAQVEAKAAAADQTCWKKSVEENAEARITAEKAIQAELDRKTQAAKNVRADLEKEENAAIQKWLQEAKETTEAKRALKTSKPKKDKSRSPAREKAAERAKQRGGA